MKLDCNVEILIQTNLKFVARENLKLTKNTKQVVKYHCL